MKRTKFATGALIIIAAGVAIYLFRKIKIKKKLTVVADAGYETARDIFYPLKINRPKKSGGYR